MVVIWKLKNDILIEWKSNKTFLNSTHFVELVY